VNELMTVFTFHFAKTPIHTSVRALLRPPTGRDVAGLQHAECLTRMTLGAPILSPARMQLHHLTMFAAWESQDAIDQFLANTSLGRAFSTGWHVRMTFQRRWGDQVRSRSTVLILGDARNNYLHPREDSLASIAERAKTLYWLNPERVAMWNDGDSIIGKYAPYCDGVYECRNIRQLRQFVEQLD